MSLENRKIKGLMLDISGVLTESASTGVGSKAIVGSVEAVKRIKKAGIHVRFVTNETQRTRQSILEKLLSHGFELTLDEIFSPTMAMAKLAKSNGLRPHFLVHSNCLGDFKDIPTSDPNCVVIGDASDEFSYKAMNDAFHVLMKPDVKLYSLGKGKYYKEDDNLVLDVGAFTAALEYATGKEATIVGKPESSYFIEALSSMGIQPSGAVMVGDDLLSDVAGAQRIGARGVLVRTGKYLKSDEDHPKVKPDLIANNLYHFVDQILT